MSYRNNSQLMVDSGKLPVGWKIKKLGEVCLVERGSSPRPIESYLTDSPDGVNWVKIGDTKNVDKYIRSTKQKITKEGAEKSRRVDVGDFILSNSMSYGKPYVMATSGYVHDGWFILRLLESIDIDFFHYLLASDFVQAQFIFLAAGSVVKNISKDLVKRAVLPIPPLSEQKRIVAILDEAFEGCDRAIRNTEQNLANSRELFESYLNAIFTQKGDQWVEKKLDEIAGKVFTGPFGSLLHKSDYISDGIPIVNPANIEGDKIIPNFNKTISQDIAIRMSAYILKHNDVVVGRRGEIGRCAVVREDQAGWLCGSGSFFIKPFENVNSIFLAHLLRSLPYRSKLEKLASGATMLNLSNQSLSELILAMPSLDEQNQITSKIDDLRIETQRLETICRQKLAALKELKQSILQKAFTGELTADKEVA
jgi:type I restriction enzyme S subunit